MVLHILSPEREKKKKVKQEVDKRRRGGKTERETEREGPDTEPVCVSSYSGRVFTETPQMMRHYLL